jgi:hypothetical protein
VLQRIRQPGGAPENLAAAVPASDVLPVIAEWEHGDFADELVEISHE